MKEQDDKEKYEKELVKKLKFQTHKEAILLRACIDVLEDTQCAIEEVFERGLEVQFNSLGERYLRLYGVLNAYYQQMVALIDLARLFNLRNQAEIKKRLKNLSIIKLRNKIGAHSTNYVDDGLKKGDYDFYKVSQTTLTKWSDRLCIVPYKSKSEEWNLIELMSESSRQIEHELFAVCKTAIISVYNHNGASRKWLRGRLDYTEKRLIN